jgi:hypothetical protein
MFVCGPHIASFKRRRSTVRFAWQVVPVLWFGGGIRSEYLTYSSRFDFWLVPQQLHKHSVGSASFSSYKVRANASSDIPSFSPTIIPFDRNMQAPTNQPPERNYFAEAYDRLVPNRSRKSRGIVPDGPADVYQLAMMDMPKAVRYTMSLSSKQQCDHHANGHGANSDAQRPPWLHPEDFHRS